MTGHAHWGIPDIRPLWRVFAVELEAPGFGPGRYVRDGYLTVEPGESLEVKRRDLECRERRRVRLVPTIAACVMLLAGQAWGLECTTRRIGSLVTTDCDDGTMIQRNELLGSVDVIPGYRARELTIDPETGRSVFEAPGKLDPWNGRPWE